MLHDPSFRRPEDEMLALLGRGEDPTPFSGESEMSNGGCGDLPLTGAGIMGVLLKSLAFSLPSGTQAHPD